MSFIFCLQPMIFCKIYWFVFCISHSFRYDCLYMHISVVIPLLQYLVNQYITCTFVEITKEKNISYVFNIYIYYFFFLSLKHSKWKEPFELRCFVWGWGRGLWPWNGQQSSKSASLNVRATFLKQAVRMFCDAAVWKCRNI